MATQAGALEILMFSSIARLQADMSAHQKTVSGAMKNIESAVASAKSALGALGGGLSVGALVLFAKHTVEAIAHMKELGQEAGTTAEAISRFEAPARTAGLGLDSVAAAMFRMSKASLEAKEPGSKAAQALNAIGISTAQLKGLKPDEMFELVARALGGYSDGLAKNNIMQELFGKSGREMNRVVAEIAEGGKLAATVTNEQAEAAQLLQKQIVELQMNSEKLWRGLLSEGVPALNDILKSFLDGAKAGGLYEAAIRGVTEALMQAKGYTLPQQLDEVNKQIKLARDGFGSLKEKTDQLFMSDADVAAAKAAKLNALLTQRGQIESQLFQIGLMAQDSRASRAGVKGDPKFDPAATAAALAATKKYWEDFRRLEGEGEMQLLDEQAKFVKAYNENLAGLRKDAQQAEVDEINARGDVLNALEDSIAQLKIENDVLGMTTAARSLYILGLERQKALKTAHVDDVAEINRLYDEAAALIKVGAAKGKLLSLPNEMAAAWTAAGQSIAESLTKAFGAGGAAAGGMFKAFADGMATQITLDAKYATDKKDETNDLAKLAQKYQDDTTQNSLQSYGDMAGAAASFFNKQSTAYKVLHGIEQAMYLMKFAMQAKSIVMDMMATTSSVANSGTRATADGIAAFAKTLASLPFPWNLAAGAAVVAALAAMGVMISGGGGGGSVHVAGSVAAQESQGTGTVFGDIAAKSESITKALEILRDNSSSDLLYTSRMLTSLLNIESSMSGMAAAVVRSQLTGAGVKLPGSGGGNAFSLDNAGIILGRATTPGSSEPDQAYSGQTVAQLIRGAIVTGFTDIAREHTGTFSGSSYTAVNREQHLLSPEDALVEAIGRTVKGIAGAIGEAVEVLTHGAMTIEQVNTLLADLPIEAMSISFADLKGDALVEALQSVFSALGDTMVTSILTPAGIQVLEEFQQVGEGAFETIIRVASGVELAQATLDQWGISMIDWQDIANKQGDVTTELIRDSIVLSQTQDDVTSSIGLLIKGFDGSADDIIALWKTLLKLSVGLRASAIDTSLLNQAMITAAGGLAALQSGLDAYNSGFFTVEEQAAAHTAELTTAFTNLGLVMPATRDAFRAMVEAATAAGDSTLVGHLLALAPAFASLVPAIAAATGAATTAGSGLAPWQQHPYGYDDPDQVAARAMAELAKAAEEAAKALDEARKPLKDWLDSLLLNKSLSPLTPMQQLEEARAQYQKTLALAQGGDLGAVGQLQGSSETYLNIAREIFASSSAYNDIFRDVYASVAGVAGMTPVDVNTRLAAALPQGQTLASGADIRELRDTLNTTVLTLITVMSNGLSVNDPENKALLEELNANLRQVKNSGVLA